MGSNTEDLKIFIVGEGNTGKTSMLMTYLSGVFPEQHLPYVHESVVKRQVNSDGVGVPLLLIDTAGAEDYDQIRPKYYPGTKCFILGYAVCKRDRFRVLEELWFNEIRSVCHDVPIILTATKIDLRETEENCVTTEEGQALAAKTRSHYAEISSLERIGLDELFVLVSDLSHHYNSSKENRKCIIV